MLYLGLFSQGFFVRTQALCVRDFRSYTVSYKMIHIEAKWINICLRCDLKCNFIALKKKNTFQGLSSCCLLVYMCVGLYKLCFTLKRNPDKMPSGGKTRGSEPASNSHFCWFSREATRKLESRPLADLRLANLGAQKCCINQDLHPRWCKNVFQIVT